MENSISIKNLKKKINSLPEINNETGEENRIKNIIILENDEILVEI